MIIVSLVGCEENLNDDNNNNDNSSIDELIFLKNGPVYSGDVVKASIYGDILKLDDITTGLNTVTMKITLYSLKEQKILGQTDTFPESDWNTGSFDGGFYAVALEHCEVILFDNNCKEILRKKLTDCENQWSFAAVSPDSKYLLYGDAYLNEIYVYCFSDDSKKRVGIYNEYAEIAGFSNGSFFLRTTDRALIKVDPTKERSEVVFLDSRLSFITPYYSLGKTDANFMVKTLNQVRSQYTKFSSVDEVPIAACESGFVTVTWGIDNDILRVYRVKEAETFAVKVPDNVQEVCFADELLIITAKDKKSDQPKLYLYNIHSAKTSPVVFTDTDIKL